MLNESTRCMGLLPSPYPEGPTRCSKRQTCERFTQRYAGGPIFTWLCPTKDDYWGAFIESQSEPHASAATN